MKKCIVTLFIFCLFVCFFSTKALCLSSKSAVVINGLTGSVIYSQNANEELAMASTTKIMTALILCQSGSLEREVIVTEEMVRVEGTSMGLKVGDTVSLCDLLYGMMLSSGNDAANAVAIYLSGSIENFTVLMNEKAKELGLNNTSFSTPSGLDGENHYTTALELAKITKKAMEYEEFRKAVSTKTATLSYGNPKKEVTLTNHNKLLKYYSDIIGVKTGYTKKAGRCLVSAARQGEKYVIAVTLNDGDDWNDHRELLDLGLSLLKENIVSVENKNVTIPIIGGKSDSINLRIKDKTFYTTDNEKIDIKVDINNMLYAPIKKGDIIGMVNYYCGDEIIYSKKLTAEKNISEDNKVTKTYFRIVIDILRRINERQ